MSFSLTQCIAHVLVRHESNILQYRSSSNLSSTPLNRQTPRFLFLETPPGASRAYSLSLVSDSGPDVLAWLINRTAKNLELTRLSLAHTAAAVLGLTRLICVRDRSQKMFTRIVWLLLSAVCFLVPCGV